MRRSTLTYREEENKLVANAISEKLSVLSDEQKSLLLRKIKAKKELQIISEKKARNDDSIPLSFLQSSMWVHQQLEPSSSAYNINLHYRLTISVDIPKFEQSLNAIIARHEILRTTFPLVNGQPVQKIAPTLHVPILIEEVAPNILDDRLAAGYSKTSPIANKAFDLANGPLVRMMLVRLAESDYLMMISFHHMVCDGSSIPMFISELGIHYNALLNGTEPQVRLMSAQYRDFAHWQGDWMGSASMAEQLNYWRERLTDLPTVELPTTSTRPAKQTYRGARMRINIDLDLAERIKAFCKQEQTTSFVAFLAAFKLLLARYVGQDDIVVGAPVEGRTRPEFEKIIGAFINAVVLRTNLSGDPTFREAVQKVRETVQGALAHQDVPFDKLVETVSPQRDPGRTPLFQIFFNRFSAPKGSSDFPGLALSALARAETQAKFDLTIFLAIDEKTPYFSAVYNTDLYNEQYLTEVFNQLIAFLVEAVNAPDIPSSSHLDANAYLSQKANEPARLIPPNPDDFLPAQLESSIPARFASVVQKHANRLAVVTKTRSWTYAELDVYSDAIASVLLGARGERHVDATEFVGLLCNNDAPMTAAMLGVLKSGHSFVPLDASHPPERLAYILQTTGAKCVLASAENMALAQEICVDGIELFEIENSLHAAVSPELAPVSKPDQLAYVLFTSGSTGHPKGVMQNHRNVMHHARAYIRAMSISPEDQVSLVASFGFDAAMMDIFGSLLSGATLHPFDLKRNGLHNLASWIIEQRITLFHSTPTVFRYLTQGIAKDDCFDEVRAVVLGGEETQASDLELFKQHFPIGSVFVNGMGPSESTLALQYFMDHSTALVRKNVPVGFPVENTEISLLNKAGLPTGIYAVGEVVIKSPYVAKGYWRQPDLTAKMFDQDTVDSNLRIYKTGDLGRRLPDGAIEFVGRADAQIKIRGNRIDLGEIEATLMRYPDDHIRESVVIARNAGGAADKELIAYLRAESGIISIASLREFLRSQLPEYMVPAAFVSVEKIPLMPNGKVDRRALPEPTQRDRYARPASRQAPRSPLENTIWRIWSEVLRIDKFGAEDNFFEVGGHSMLLVEVSRRLSAEFKSDFPLIDLFRYPTISSFSKFIEQKIN
jgi:amino acid adenylation domain-containing protein